MAKNNDLFNALNDLTALSGKDTKERNDALEAIIKADPADPIAFRKALNENDKFWKPYGFMTAPSQWTWTGGLMGPGKPVPGYLESDDFLAPNDAKSFTKLRQLAVEQRVKLGLKNAEDDVLIEILKNNTAETRAYLADKQFNFLSQAHGWVKTPEPPAPVPPAAPEAPKNTSTEVLTDDAVKNIQKAALDQLLLKYIHNSKDKNLLDNLLNARDSAAVKTAATALKFPQTALHALKYPLSSEVNNVIKELTTKMEQDATAAKFPKFVNDLKTNEVLDYRDALESNNLSDFTNKLPQDYKAELLVNQQEAKNLIGARFLQEFIPTIENDDLGAFLPALNAANDAGLKTELKTIVPSGRSTDYINTAVTKDNMSAIKSAVLKAHIRNLDSTSLEKLKKLDKAEPFAAFKTVLNELDIHNTNWINSSDMGAIKQEVRTRIFEHQVDNASSFELAAHKHLVKAFKNLTVAKQRELLAKPEPLNNILHAKELNQVEHYFGRETDASTNIIAENKALEPFKKIHNSEVARILENLKPRVVLDEDKIRRINSAFITPAIPPAPPAPLNLALEADFTNLRDAIKAVVGNNPTIDFDFVSAKEKIRDQHSRNIQLFQAYHGVPAPSLADKKIYDVYLGAKKQNVISGVIAHLTTVRPNSNEAPLFKSLKSELEPLINAKENEKTKVELTDAATFEGRITILTKSLEAGKKDHKSLVANAKEIKKLSDIQDIHLLNPAFQGKAKSKSVDMLERFQQMADDCNIVVDQLRRQKAQLEGFIGSLPHIDDVDDANELAFLHYSHDSKIELTKINEDLALYEKAQAKLYGDKANNKQGILEVIESAAEGKGNYIYNKISSHLLGQEAKKIPAVEVALAEAGIGAQGDKLPFLLGENLTPGQVRVYDFAHKTTTATQNGPQPVEYKGQFTEEHSVSGTQEFSGSFKIKEFPKAPQIRPSSEVEKTKLQNEFAKAKVQFSLAMAVQTLASMDGMPSKDNKVILRGTDGDMLKHLYAAFITLGVDKNSIKVRSSAFDPDQEKGMIWGFSKESLVESVFKDTAHSAAVKDSKKDLERIMDLKNDKSGVRKKTESNVTDATRLFKKENADIIEKAKKQLDEEGPAPSTRPPRA